jgi:hypothetical protein
MFLVDRMTFLRRSSHREDYKKVICFLPVMHSTIRTGWVTRKGAYKILSSNETRRDESKNRLTFIRFVDVRRWNNVIQSNWIIYLWSSFGLTKTFQNDERWTLGGIHDSASTNAKFFYWLCWKIVAQSIFVIFFHFTWNDGMTKPQMHPKEV